MLPAKPAPWMNSPFGRFRLLGLLEGSSFLLLLLVAMPLKYYADLPLAVRIVGWLHGLLFVLYLFSAFRVGSERKWPLSRLGLAFVAAILPLGTFVFDASLRREEAQASGLSEAA